MKLAMISAQQAIDEHWGAQAAAQQDQGGMPQKSACVLSKPTLVMQVSARETCGLQDSAHVRQHAPRLIARPGYPKLYMATATTLPLCTLTFSSSILSYGVENGCCMNADPRRACVRLPRA